MELKQIVVQKTEQRVVLVTRSRLAFPLPPLSCPPSSPEIDGTLVGEIKALRICTCICAAAFTRQVTTAITITE